MVARLKLKEIDGRAPPGVNAVNSAPESSPMKRVVVPVQVLVPAPAGATPSNCGEPLKLALRTGC
jgi:hypothetical protein